MPKHVSEALSRAAELRRFGGGFIGFFKLNGYESLSISSRYP
jgi:hypothetical protein